MGFLHDLLLETRCEEFEKDLKEAYGMGFRDGRLCGPDLRPCLADEKPATFHRWVDEATDRLNLNEGTIERNHSVSALVEYPDGSVGKVKPELIQFLGRKEG